MSKRAIAFFSCCLFSFSALARENCISGEFEANLNQLEEVTAKVKDCPKPKDSMFTQLCAEVGSMNPDFHTTLRKMACADVKKDSPKTLEEKVSSLWEKYREDFGCDSTGFPIEMGNVLKYSVYNRFSGFVDSVVKQYNLDINFKDPADGKTVLDFIKEETARSQRMANSKERVKELEELYKHFRVNLKAKHAHEI